MNSYYIPSLDNPSYNDVKKPTTIEDFDNIRANYVSELKALRRRYLERMIKCAENMVKH